MCIKFRFNFGLLKIYNYHALFVFFLKLLNLDWNFNFKDFLIEGSILFRIESVPILLCLK